MSVLFEHSDASLEVGPAGEDTTTVRGEAVVLPNHDGTLLLIVDTEVTKIAEGTSIHVGGIDPQYLFWKAGALCYKLTLRGANERLLHQARATLAYEPTTRASKLSGPRNSICLVDEDGDIVSVLQTNVELASQVDEATQRLSGPAHATPSESDKAFQEQVEKAVHGLQGAHCAAPSPAIESVPNEWADVRPSRTADTVPEPAARPLLDSAPATADSSAFAAPRELQTPTQGGVLLSFFNKTSKFAVRAIDAKNADNVVPADPFYLYSVLKAVTSPLKACYDWLSSWSLASILDGHEAWEAQYGRRAGQHSVMFFDERGFARPAYRHHRF